MVNSGASMPGPAMQARGPPARVIPQGYFKYNFNRPHQSFDYLAPGVYIEKEVTKIRSPVLPVWSASIRVRQNRGRASFRGIALSRYLP